MQSLEPPPKPLDPRNSYIVTLALEKTYCDECDCYRNRGEYIILVREGKTLCSWGCALVISERGIVESHKKYGWNADQLNKKAKEDRMNYWDENEAYKYKSRERWGKV